MAPQNDGDAKRRPDGPFHFTDHMAQWRQVSADVRVRQAARELPNPEAAMNGRKDRPLPEHTAQLVSLCREAA